MNRVAIMCYGAPSGAHRAPELAESKVLLILMLFMLCLCCASGLRFAMLSAFCSALCFALLSAVCSAFRTQDCSRQLEHRPPNGSKTTLKSILGPLGELLELSWQPGGLLEASWNALGALLGASGVQKTLLGSALGRPKGTLETAFSDLGSQMPSQKEPWRVPNRGPKVIQAENGKIIKLVHCTQDFLDF